MSDPLADEVIGILAEAKRRPPDTISPDSSLVELGFDSLDVITTVFELESKFKISISDDYVRSLRTVRDVVEGVRTLIAEKTAHA
jgi:acyl carrier protein